MAGYVSEHRPAPTCVDKGGAVVLCSLEHLPACVDGLGLVRPLRAHMQALQALPRCLQVLQQLALAACSSRGLNRREEWGRRGWRRRQETQARGQEGSHQEVCAGCARR